MPDQLIKYFRENNIAEIVLNNPPLNIMTQEMMTEINGVLHELIPDTRLQLLVFRAKGKHFSAGADVTEHTKEKCPEMIPVFMELFTLLHAIQCPTLAIVQGMALGGGCELATFCDLVLASEKAKFGQPEISLGVFPPVALATFPHLVGRKKTLELLLTGESISASEAERIGLINKVFPEENFGDRVNEFLDKLKNKSPLVLKMTKTTLDQGISSPLSQAMESASRTYLTRLMETRDANEGIQAFLEKRTPVWKGE